LVASNKHPVRIDLFSNETNIKPRLKGDDVAVVDSDRVQFFDGEGRFLKKFERRGEHAGLENIVRTEIFSSQEQIATV
jgi:hypothetical protein